MNLLAITAGRINGNTQRAVSVLCGELGRLAEKESRSLDGEIMKLGETELSLCRGCRACFEKGEERCPCKDLAADIARKMRQADIIIMASPVYVEDISGSMKNLIDRMAYNCYRQALAGKAAYVITTSGVGSTSHATKTMKAALGFWGLSVIGTLRLRMSDRMGEEELTSRYGKELKAAAISIYAKLERTQPKPSLRSIIVFKVQQLSWQKEQKQSLTREYWMKRGWLDKRCTYYVPHGRSRAFVTMARAVGRVVALFFV